MIKTVTYEAVDKSALRKKGWKLFAVILSLQLIFFDFGLCICRCDILRELKNRREAVT